MTPKKHREKQYFTKNGGCGLRIPLPQVFAAANRTTNRQHYANAEQQRHDRNEKVYGSQGSDTYVITDKDAIHQ